MPEGKIALRQLLCLLFAALLSPTVRVLPGRTAAAAGAAGWLCTLTALPVLLGLCWVLFALFRTAGPEDGLAQIFQRALGRLPGKALALLYLLWGLCLLCVNARLFALRLLSTSYRNAPLKLFLVVLLAVALWLARKKLPALVRAGEIFYLALSLCLGVVLFLGLFRVEPQNVLPVWVQDVPEVLRGTLPALSVVGYVIFGAFLGGGVARKEGNRRRAMRCFLPGAHAAAMGVPGGVWTRFDTADGHPLFYDGQRRGCGRRLRTGGVGGHCPVGAGRSGAAHPAPVLLLLYGASCLWLSAARKRRPASCSSDAGGRAVPVPGRLYLI